MALWRAGHSSCASEPIQRSSPRADRESPRGRARMLISRSDARHVFCVSIWHAAAASHHMIMRVEAGEIYAGARRRSMNRRCETQSHAAAGVIMESEPDSTSTCVSARRLPDCSAASTCSLRDLLRCSARLILQGVQCGAVEPAAAPATSALPAAANARLRADRARACPGLRLRSERRRLRPCRTRHGTPNPAATRPIQIRAARVAIEATLPTHLAIASSPSAVARSHSPRSYPKPPADTPLPTCRK
jgi:hypothetical protein